VTVLKSTIKLAVATLIFRLLGFVRDMVLAAGYGAGTVSDAFILANVIPTMVFSGLGMAIANSFLPQYQESGEDKEYFLSNVLNIVLIGSVIIAFIFMLAPQFLVFLFASQLDSDTFALTTSFLQISIWTAIPLLLIYLFRISLHTKGVFFVSQLALLCINIGSISAIAASYYTGQLNLMPIGLLLGNLLSLAVMAVMAIKHGFTYRPIINLKDDRIRNMLPFMAPLLIAMIGEELQHIIDKNFASSLEAGTISALGYSGRISSQFSVIIGMSIAAVMYPKMMKLGSSGETELLVGYVKKYLQMLIPLTLPFTVGLILLAEPATALLYERGAFTPEDTRITAESLRMYTIGIGFISTNLFLSKMFFAVNDTKTPVRLHLITICVGVILNFILIGPMRHMGLALSTSLSGILHTALLLWALRRRFGILGIMDLKKECFKALSATFVMGFTVWAGIQFLPITEGGSLQMLILTAIPVIMGIGIYFFIHFLFRSIFLCNCIAIIKKNLKMQRDENYGKKR